MGNPEQFKPEFGNKFEKIKEEKQSEKFREFLTEQIALPEREWSEEFKNYTKEKYKEQVAECPERSSEEEKRLIFQRYLKGLDLNLEDLKGKRILDLGCGEEGEFVEYCLDRDLAEVYGLDLSIKPETIEKKYRNYLFKGSFEEELPVKNLDLAISFGAIEAPSNKDELDKMDPRKTLNSVLKSIKENGEIRIYPIRKAPPESKLKGVEFSRKKWLEILDDLSSQGLIRYELKPIDIRVGGKKPDVWLEEALILKKKLKMPEEEREEGLSKARGEVEEAFGEEGEK